MISKIRGVGGNNLPGVDLNFFLAGFDLDSLVVFTDGRCPWTETGSVGFSWMCEKNVFYMNCRQNPL